jgi:uncharacterized protein YcaQ
MEAIRITKEQARKFLLQYHGLNNRERFRGKDGILAYIGRVGCIQFDPLNIVGHNQELVLQSRIDGFKPAMLRELLYGDRLLMDGWDKVMSICLTCDWPYFKRYREDNLERLGHADKPVTPYLPMIRQEIRERGPLSSLELEYGQSVNWPWGPTRVSRAALESMYFWGELIIHHKVNTRKIYDFAERHLPKELLEAPDPNETFEQYRDWRILRRIGGVGLLWAKPGDAWLEIPETKTPQRLESVQRLLASGKLAEVDVEGMNVPLYLRSEDLPLLEKVLAPAGTEHTGAAAPGGSVAPAIPAAPVIPASAAAPTASILAPLDNLLWDRRLVKDLFDFDYRWEVYKPVSERNYGYYVLPVLYGDRFVARFEPGYDKKAGILVLKNWWWEKGVKPTKPMRRELAACFRRFMAYLGAKAVLPGEDLQAGWMDWISTI